MKILHTSDWHLGKRLHGASFIEDQRQALEDLLRQVEREQPHVLIVAGDIYDRSVPPVEAVTLADTFFSQLRAISQCAVLVISGNHDSPERLGFGRGFLAASDFYMGTQLEDALNPIDIEVEDLVVRFFLMPYLEPAIVKSQLQRLGLNTEWPSTQEGLFSFMKTQWQPMLLKASNREKQVHNVLVAHTFFAKVTEMEVPEESESERPLSIGGHDMVDVSLVADFDYVALGHLHRPQKVGRDTIRYSGSLLKYSFSEVDQPKGITWIQWCLGQEEPAIFQTTLGHSRDVRRIEGTLEALLSTNQGNVEDYILAVLEDEGALHEPMRRLRSVYPNCLRLERSVFNRQGGGLQDGARPGDSSREEGIEKHPEKAFEVFYRFVHGEEPSDDILHLFEDLVQNLDGEDKL